MAPAREGARSKEQDDAADDLEGAGDRRTRRSAASAQRFADGERARRVALNTSAIPRRPTNPGDDPGEPLLPPLCGARRARPGEREEGTGEVDGLQVAGRVERGIERGLVDDEQRDRRRQVEPCPDPGTDRRARS